jgi:hypothetical protein
MIKNTFADEMTENKVWGVQTNQKAVMALAQIVPDENSAWFDDVNAGRNP